MNQNTEDVYKQLKKRTKIQKKKFKVNNRKI